MKGFKKVKKPTKKTQAKVDAFAEHNTIMVQAAKDDLENQAKAFEKEKEHYEQLIDELTSELCNLKTDYLSKCEELSEAKSAADFWEARFVNIVERGLN